MMTRKREKKTIQLPKFWTLPKWLTNREVRLLKKIHAADPSLSMESALRKLMSSTFLNDSDKPDDPSKH